MTTAPLAKSFATIHGKQMAYHESGDGAPGAETIVFLHGNPTSSYLWRDVIPHVRDDAQVRCIAPDLIGMGDSDKLDDSGPGSYRFVEHRHYLDGLLDHLELGDRVTLVVHDWGSALGFDWANRHRDRIAGVAYMEAIVRPLGWDEWPDWGAPVLRGAALARRRRDDPDQEPVRRDDPAGVDPAHARGRRDGGVPPPVRRRPAKGGDRPSRGRVRSRSTASRPTSPTIVQAYADWLVDVGRPEAVRERRARLDPRRRPTGVLPDVAEPDRGHRRREPLHPGGQRRPDRPGARRMARDVRLSRRCTMRATTRSVGTDRPAVRRRSIRRSSSSSNVSASVWTRSSRPTIRPWRCSPGTV